MLVSSDRTSQSSDKEEGKLNSEDLSIQNNFIWPSMEPHLWKVELERVSQELESFEGEKQS